MSDKQVLPNPLEISFGDGRIAIRKFTDDEGRFGVILTDTFSPHIIGSEDGLPKEGHEPKEGEVYLSFSNEDALRVVLEELLDCSPSHEVSK